MDHIVQAINAKGAAIYNKEWKVIDCMDLMSLIGLHLRSEVDKNAFKPVAKFFSTKTGLPIYCASISRERFKTNKKVHKI